MIEQAAVQFGDIFSRRLSHNNDKVNTVFFYRFSEGGTA